MEINYFEQLSVEEMKEQGYTNFSPNEIIYQVFFIEEDDGITKFWRAKLFVSETDWCTA